MYQGEVLAVQRAAEKLVTLEGTEDINLFIDNQAVILSLTNQDCTSRTVYNCRGKLTQLTETWKVTLYWVHAMQDMT